MPKDPTLLTLRNDKITAAYVEMSKLGYSDAHIRAEISARYFLAPRTIYGIVSGEYDRRKKECDDNRDQI